MNGFLIIGYNKNVGNNIAIKEYENFLTAKNTIFSSTAFISEQYQYLHGYQFFDNYNDSLKTHNSNVFFCGKIFGSIREKNTKKLSYKECINFVNQNNSSEDVFFAFDGSCSLARIDSSTITIQNDVEGYKKVFYYISDDIFCVSTNLTHILKVILKKWTIRKNAVYSYLLQRESKWPLTFIEDIQVLSPLTKAIISEKEIKFKYATFSDFYNTRRVNKKEVIKEVYEDFVRIINREDSKNIAVTLSGGVDSNCLTKLYKQSYKNNFTAVSLGYASEREKDVNVYDESIYAEKIAKHLKIPFKRYIVDKTYFLSQVDNFITSIDQPGHDPSSNFLLNDLLQKDGFDTIISGMGGDAFFSSKSKLKFAKTLFEISRHTNSYYILNKVSELLRFKSFLKNFDSGFYLKKPTSFIQLREIQKLNKPSLENYISKIVHKELFKEADNRLNYYKNIEKKANVILEEFYSYALFSNPDEYHADTMAQRNNLNILMPFVNIVPASKLLNASKYIDINNRDFEMELFGGINKDLLLKSKSGFSFPYTEWAGEFFKETMNFYKEKSFFNDDLFNIDKFIDDYKNKDLVKNSLSVNQLIWKLTVVKKYVELHSISLD